MQYTGWLWYDGTVGLSVKKPLREKGQRTANPKRGTETERSLQLRVHGLLNVLRFRRVVAAMREAKVPFMRGTEGGLDAACKRFGVLCPTALPGFGLVKRPQLAERSPRGRSGLTQHGKRLVRNAAILLQDTHGHKRLSFLTCTLPALGSDALRRIHQNWHRLLQLFRTKLRDELRSHGLSPEIVGVTEIQMGRLQNRNEYALHIHWVFQGRQGLDSQWLIRPARFAELWNDAVMKHSGVKFDGQRCPSTRVESIRRSAADYLSKYISKGAGSIAAVIDSGYEDQLPHSWYTCTKALRSEVLGLRVRLHGNSAAWMLNEIENDPDCFAFVKAITVSYRERDISVGYAARYLPERLQEKREQYELLNDIFNANLEDEINAVSLSLW